MDKQKLLAALPSVDEIVKSKEGAAWLEHFPRTYVLKGIRDIIQRRREAILEGKTPGVEVADLVPEMGRHIERLSSYSLRRVINATGVVVHTNLGRSVLPEEVLQRVVTVAGGYSNLEYDLEEGRRGKRYAHVQDLLREITGAEDGVIVNNNAAAVFVCLSALAKGREVIVSRGELVEIGGSFRIPDVMANSGAVLREVGTTNKTHLRDYEGAVSERTGLLLKVHQSNFRIVGFTQAPSVEELSALGRKHGIPMMFDLGSGCLVDLKPYGVHIEPTVQEVVRAGADLVTISGDKLLGGPQCGAIVGRMELIEKIAKNPLMRAVRVDKMTLAAFEATLRYYLDLETAKAKVPTLAMLLQEPEKIRARAKRLAAAIKKAIATGGADVAAVQVIEDSSQSGGGALAEVEFRTFAVSVKPRAVSVNALEKKLREHSTPIVGRIKEECLLLDARTIRNEEVLEVAKGVRAALLG